MAVPPPCSHVQDLYPAIFWAICAITCLTASGCMAWSSFPNFRQNQRTFNRLYLDKQLFIVLCVVRVFVTILLVSLTPVLNVHYVRHTWLFEFPLYLYILALAYWTTQAYVAVDLHAPSPGCCTCSPDTTKKVRQLIGKWCGLVYILLASGALTAATIAPMIQSQHSGQGAPTPTLSYATLTPLLIATIVLECSITVFVVNRMNLEHLTHARSPVGDSVRRVVLPVFERLKYVLPALVCALIAEFIVVSWSTFGNLSLAFYAPFLWDKCEITWTTAFWYAPLFLAWGEVGDVMLPMAI
eukprot:TRINITY_DN93776_c0_g1_i1.p1 TRINITY_DN93776_c0_g1~~TRINITY_DN93776_c0_g1_i1.p1  ORF type:complete len:298 (-),score=-1.28 TRINITY_DN93776_c0_g1_i1:8-901(-)